MARPNILLIHSHDTGRYVQPYGNAVFTPHLQKLAEQGLLFRQAYSAAPTCSPSRSAMLTGQCPHSAGMLGLAHRGFSLNNCNNHLANVLREAGYHTVLTGVQHETTLGQEQLLGYNQVLVTEDYQHKTAQAAVDFLQGNVSQPFFLSVGFHNAHRPFPDIHPDDDPRFCPPPAPLPDAPETRHDFTEFKSAVRELDELMGQVLNALDANGLADDTLVICTTDHGIAFPHMKGNLTGHGTGVMLIMRGPGGFTGGNVTDGLVSQLDIFPTLCELLELDPPDRLEGRSLLPLIRGEVDQINDAVFSELTYHAAYEPMRGVRTDRWNYVRRFSSRDRPVMSNCDDGPSKDLLVRNGWTDTSLPREELYDLVFDPQEANNIAAHESSEQVLQAMRQRLSDWMRQTNDPLCHGPVCPPPEAMQNNPDSLSPDEPIQPFTPSDSQWQFS